MMRKRMARLAPRSLKLTIVAWAVLAIGGCANAGEEAGQNASQDAGQAQAAPDVGQAQADAEAGAGCWVRGDPAELADRESPFDSTEVTLDAGTLKVCYSRPQRRGRTIMGDLVPFGEPWRLGANEATAIYVSAPASIGEVDVEPGWYTLYAVPGEEQWEIVVNSATQRWGIGIDEDVRANDVGAALAASEPTDAPVEMLTMTLERTSPTEATLVTEWEETRVSVPIRMR